jgi:hypothetical protein
VETLVQRAFELAGPITLDVAQPVGTIELGPAPPGTATVEILGDGRDARRFAEMATVDLQDRAGGQVLVAHIDKKALPRFGISIGKGFRSVTMRITCPPHTALVLKTVAADVVSSVDVGAARVASVSGDVELRAIDGDLDVGVTSADVRTGPVAGAASVKTVSGDVHLAGVARDVQATTVSGDVVVDEVSAGTVNIRAVSGDVRLGVRKGSQLHLDLSAVSGKTSTQFEVSDEPAPTDGPTLDIRVNSVSGDIHVGRADSSLGGRI